VWNITVAILAQGTSWAAAVTQASFALVRIPSAFSFRKVTAP